MKIYKKYKLSDKKKNEILKSFEPFFQKEDILFAYVFGSFIKKNGFNDIDIAVYFREKKDIDFFNKALSLSSNLTMHSEYDVNVISLNEAPISIKFNVLKNGELIYENDIFSRIFFETSTIKYYFDFEHFRKLYKKIFFEGLKNEYK